MPALTRRADRSSIQTRDAQAMPQERMQPSGQQELRIGALVRLVLEPLVLRLRRWWMQRIERHCMICADVEEQRARQAQQNVAYYQKQAAIARLAQQ